MELAWRRDAFRLPDDTTCRSRRDFSRARKIRSACVNNDFAESRVRELSPRFSRSRADSARFNIHPTHRQQLNATALTGRIILGDMRSVAP